MAETPSDRKNRGVKSEDAVTALADLLGNPEANTRRLAVVALGENGNESVFRKLRPLLDDADSR
ncbi:MAG: HEAT repeat domain-containing protein, partial [Bacteroidota bacterium]